MPMISSPPSLPSPSPELRAFTGWVTLLGNSFIPQVLSIDMMFWFSLS